MRVGRALAVWALSCKNRTLLMQLAQQQHRAAALGNLLRQEQILKLDRKVSRCGLKNKMMVNREKMILLAIKKSRNQIITRLTMDRSAIKMMTNKINRNGIRQILAEILAVLA